MNKIEREGTDDRQRRLLSSEMPSDREYVGKIKIQNFRVKSRAEQNGNRGTARCYEGPKGDLREEERERFSTEVDGKC